MGFIYSPRWLSLPVAATEVNLSLCFKNYGLTNPIDTLSGGDGTPRMGR